MSRSRNLKSHAPLMRRMPRALSLARMIGVVLRDRSAKRWRFPRLVGNRQSSTDLCVLG